jgi:transposase
MAEENPVSLSSIAKSQQIPAKEFEKQYKNQLSGFNDWNQKEHADEWLLFEENIGEKMSIDEVAVTNGELYTIITNKKACGGKGSLAGILSGTKASDIIPILAKIPEEKRKTVREVTLDMSHSMDAIIRNAFPLSTIVIDRFHVQKLVSEAVQEIRIGLRREVLSQENKAIKKAGKEGKRYHPKTYENGDTKKQLLARSRYLLFKSESKWTDSQKARAVILFKEFPEIKKAYESSMMFRLFYEHSQTLKKAKENLDRWYMKVKEKNIDSFLTVAESIRLHETNILNYFINRSTNASAESFNAKLKGFRGLVRGVRDKKFFLFRVTKLCG